MTVPAKAGMRTVGVSFIAADAGNRKACSSRFRPAIRSRSTNSTTASPRSTASRSTDRSRSRARRHAEPPAGSSLCRPTSAATKTPCAKQILSTLARRAYRRPVSDDDVRTLIEFYQTRPQGRQLRCRHSVRARAHPGRSRLPVPHRARSGGRQGRRAVPAQRSRAGLAAVVLPLEQHPGRRAARRRPRADG